SPWTVELLLERRFVYDSSLMGDDYTPYRCRTGDTVSREGPFLRGPESTLWEMPISWSLDDYPVFEYTRRPGILQQGLTNARAVLENWVSDAVYLKNNLERGVITYTMHPQVIGRGHRMVMLQALIGSLRDLGFEFKTMMESLFIREAADRYGYVCEGWVNDCGYQSVGVPGTVAGLDELLRRFGTVSWDQAVLPAVKYARDGFPVTGNVRTYWVTDYGPDVVPNDQRVQWTPEAKRIYTRAGSGELYGLGEVIKNEDQARTLERLAAA